MAIAPHEVGRQWWLCQHGQARRDPGLPGSVQGWSCHQQGWEFKFQLLCSALSDTAWISWKSWEVADKDLLDFTHSVLCSLQLNPQPEPLSQVLFTGSLSISPFPNMGL